MKKLFYQLPSSRSFTRLLSILPFAVVAFAALQLVFVQQALAGVYCCNNTTRKCICDASLACPSTHPTNSGKLCYTTGKIVDQGTINSTIECTGGGSNIFDSTSVSRDAILDCTVKSDPPDSVIQAKAFCQLDLTYSRAGLATECTQISEGTYTIKHEAFCKEVGAKKAGLTVAGTLNCCDPILNPLGVPDFCGDNPNPILKLGVAGTGNCSMFPADSDLGLAEGQILSLSQTFANSTCSGPPTSVSDAAFRYCNGNSFTGADPDCTFGSKDATIEGLTDNLIQFDVDFSPEVLNVTCNNSDVWRFKIFGNQSLNPALIDVDSLRVEGFGGVSCANAVTVKVKGKTETYRDCQIEACPASGPQLGRFVAEERENGQFVLTVTGELEAVPPAGVGTGIFGEQLVTTSGQ